MLDLARSEKTKSLDGNAARTKTRGQTPGNKAPANLIWQRLAMSSWRPNAAQMEVLPSRPRIEASAIRFGRLPSDDSHSLERRADGSLEDLEDDQDRLMSDVFERKPSGRGVHIRVTGGNPAGTPDFPDGIRWIQTIDTTAPLFGLSPPYVDFVPPPDAKPFYFNDAMEAAKGGTFSDSPSRSANGVRWDATLSLVGVAGRTVTRLDSVNYGFDIDTAGSLNLHRPSTTGVSDVVVQGDTLRSEYPNWVFSGGFAVAQVPQVGPAGGTSTA